MINRKGSNSLYGFYMLEARVVSNIILKRLMLLYIRTEKKSNICIVL